METTAIPAGTIVVGTDGSPSAERALEWAIDQAQLESRQLTLAHGVDPSGSVWVDPAGVDHRAVLEALHSDAVVMLEHAREQVARRAPELVVHEVVRMSDARHTLLELSEEAALVVVGSRGRAGPVGSRAADRMDPPDARHGPTEDHARWPPLDAPRPPSGSRPSPRWSSW